jgi:hypothetical protein
MGFSFSRRGEISRRDRRRAARRHAGWMSSYVVATELQPWSVAMADNVPCVVRDLSIRGAGLELAQQDVRDGDQLVLDLQLGSSRRASIQLIGEVRHATPATNGCVRVGVEFVGMGTLEHAVLDRLLADLPRRPEPTPDPLGAETDSLGADADPERVSAHD